MAKKYTVYQLKKLAEIRSLELSESDLDESYCSSRTYFKEEVYPFIEWIALMESAGKIKQLLQQ